jgi:hypothetical protein
VEIGKINDVVKSETTTVTIVLLKYCVKTSELLYITVLLVLFRECQSEPNE